MPYETLFQPLTFTRGPTMKNRFMLAPLTNQQSHADGTLSDEEFRWLTMRAQGGFGLTMTCAAHVQKVGQGFEGQLGIFGDQHLEGLTRLASAINAAGSISSVQIHHAGNRAPKDLVGTPVCPSDDPETGARGLTEDEVYALAEAYIQAAVRAEKAGFHGVEIHGAHGYILAEFLSPELNHRQDRFGGSVEKRAQIVLDIIDGIRARCRPDFHLGLRLSPERFGLKLGEILETTQEILGQGKIDYLDMSLWDVMKEPNEPEFKGRSLMSYFTGLDRGNVRLGVAGKITTPAIAAQMLDDGADYVLIGRAAILHHDFVNLSRDRDFRPIALPAPRAHLLKEGLSPAFVQYMDNWKGFVGPVEVAA